MSLGAIFLLLCFSGFFSGSETALTATSLARMHSLERDKDNKDSRKAAVVVSLLETKDRLIGALLLGNNLVNILASALATSALIKLFGEAGVVYATLGMTLLVLIFAEVLPKTYAINNADKMSLKISPVIKVLVAVFSPITEAIIKIVRGTLWLFRVDVTTVNVGHHYEILRGVIEMHQGENQETQEERAMLRSILDLPDVEVEDIMTHRRDVLLIDAGQSPHDVISQVLDSPYTRLPLWRDDQDNIVGVLHTKLLLKEWHKCDGDISRIRIENATLEPWFIPETTTLYDQLQEFRSRREHFALVVDEYGSFRGIVTLEDILEEIVGEIDDEHDIAVKGVRPQPDGSYVIDGKVTIRDLKREFEWDLPDAEYSTLAGLILYETQSIPQVGQKFQYFDFRFEVLRRQRNQISLIRVIPPVEDEETDQAGED
ncbi:MAG: HlyC/CorC family transporter [Pseudomonadota bacterium]